MLKGDDRASPSGATLGLAARSAETELEADRSFDAVQPSPRAWASPTPTPAPVEAPPAGPRHVAIIMDGNGRWARARRLPRLEGHRQGAEAVRNVVKACPDLGIEVLTLFAFSTENWKRSTEEVSGLMSLFRYFMRRELATLAREGVRIRFLGDPEPLAPDIRRLMESAVDSTKDNTRLTLAVALNYGGRAEIAAATRRLALRVAAGEIAPEAIDEAALTRELYTADLPDPDLLIRTSGEQRLSNFLLWQSAYTEFVFAPEHWPDFDGAALARAVAAYGGRDRRFGAAVG